MPLLIGTGGNAGAQAATTVVRAMVAGYSLGSTWTLRARSGGATCWTSSRDGCTR